MISGDAQGSTGDEFDPNFNVGLIESAASRMLRDEYQALEIYNRTTIEHFEPDGPVSELELRTHLQSSQELEALEPQLSSMLREFMYLHLGVALFELSPDDPDYIYECHYTDGISVDQIRYITRVDGVRIPAWIASGVNKDDGKEYYSVTLFSNEHLEAEVERLEQLEQENEVDQQLHKVLGMTQHELDALSFEDKQQCLEGYYRRLDWRTKLASGDTNLAKTRKRLVRTVMPALRLLDSRQTADELYAVQSDYSEAIGETIADNFCDEPLATEVFYEEEERQRIDMLNFQWNLRRLAAVIRSVVLSGGAGLVGLTAGLQDGQFNYVLSGPPLREGLLFGSLALAGVGADQARRTRRMFGDRRKFTPTANVEPVFDPLDSQLYFEERKADMLKNHKEF